MISILLGLVAAAGGGFWLYKLTETMPEKTKLRYAAVAVLLLVAGALIG